MSLWRRLFGKSKDRKRDTPVPDFSQFCSYCYKLSGSLDTITDKMGNRRTICSACKSDLERFYGP